MKIRIFKKRENGEFRLMQNHGTIKSFKSWMFQFSSYIVEYGPDGFLAPGSSHDAFDYFKKNWSMIFKPNNKDEYSIDRRG